MKHFTLKLTLLLCALIVGNSAWATSYVAYEGSTRKNSTTISSSNVSSGSAGVISWTGTSCTYSNNRVNISANGSITFTAETGYNITKIVIVSGSSNTYYGTWTSSPAVAPTSSNGTTTFDGLSASSVTVTTSTAFRCTNASSISIYYEAATASDPVAVTGVSLDESSLSLIIGSTATLTPTITPANATDKTVSWESSNEAVATVENGVVTAVGVGTCTITATTTDGSLTATCSVTVSPAPAVSATLDFTDKEWGFPDDYVKTAETYTNGGYTVTFGASSNGHKAMKSGSDITGIIFGKENATLSLPAFPFAVKQIIVYGISQSSAKITYNIFVGDDAVSTAVTGSTTDHQLDIAADKQAAGNIYTIKLTNANNCQISKIEVFGYERATIGSAEYATYVPKNNVNFSDATAYVVTAASGYATLESVTSVPAGTPVILQGDADTYDFFVPATAPSAPASNLLLASDGTVEGDGSSIYVLADDANGVGFYLLAEGDKLDAGKAYLKTTSGAAAKAFIGFNFDGQSSAIEAVTMTDALNTGRIYNLSGQQMKSLQKGLNIVNGKKVFIK